MFRRLRQLFGKKLQNVPHFAKKHEKSSISPRLAIFLSTLPCFGVWVKFLAKCCKKSARFRKKAWKIVDLGKTCNFFEETNMFWRLGQLFGKKLQNVPDFAKKHEKSLILRKLPTVSSRKPCFGVWVNLSAKSSKKPHFAKKHEKSLIWPKLDIFSRKLLCFGIWVNFSAKSWKKCLISRKSMKNCRFGQNLQVFCRHYCVSAFGSTFRQKASKGALFPEKAWKIVDLAKPCNVFEETTMFRVWVNFSAKSCKRCIISRESIKNPRFGKNLQRLWGNYHVSSSGRTIRQKVAKGASFREKTSKIFDWAKTCNVFEETTMFRRLGELFSKRLQKVPHFAKKHKKSSIWPKLHTFSSRLTCFGIWVNFSVKSCIKCLISRKTMKNRRFGQNLQLSRADYHGSAFRWTFRQKVAKCASFREKVWKIVDLAKTCNFFEKTTVCRRLGQVFGKKLQKVPHFAKKHENSSIWPKLVTLSIRLPRFGVWVNF